MISWFDIWEKKGLDGAQKNKPRDLSELMNLDGFDTGHGSMTVDSWLSLVDFIKRKLEIGTGAKILEIGCGSGALLYPLYGEKKYDLYGLDFSPSMIEIARKVMPLANFSQGHAAQLPYSSNVFDAVVCNSTFHYFNDLNYASEVLNEMYRVLKPGSCGFVVDINDLSKKEYAEHVRQERLGVSEYQKKYEGLTQLYYDKDWFKNFALTHGADFEILDQQIQSYKNSEWRYNFLFRKK